MKKDFFQRDGTIVVPFDATAKERTRTWEHVVVILVDMSVDDLCEFLEHTRDSPHVGEVRQVDETAIDVKFKLIHDVIEDGLENLKRKEVMVSPDQDNLPVEFSPQLHGLQDRAVAEVSYIVDSAIDGDCFIPESDSFLVQVLFCLSKQPGMKPEVIRILEEMMVTCDECRTWVNHSLKPLFAADQIHTSRAHRSRR